MSLVIAGAWIIAGVVVVASAYRALFTFSYLFLTGQGATENESSHLRRFAVIIPAHDEELLIEDVIKTIRAADYDQDRIEIHVIADNCSDKTSVRTRALGETVHERHDPEHPGKGQAIAWMITQLDFSGIDAVALFDADNLVDRGFFGAMNRELAAGRRCLQGYNGIANPGESVMTRLLTVTYVMRNLLFNAGKARLGLSVVLNGTGMVFSGDVLSQGGWKATSIGEDLEQTFWLLERGERMHFVPDAVTRAQEATTLRQGYTQRQRWATGRRALAARGRSAIVEGIRHRSLHRIDTGVDILMPTYSKLLNWTVVAGAVGLAVVPWSVGPAIAVAGSLLYQVCEVVIALGIMRAEPRFVASLLFAPIFLLWKASIDLLAVIGYRRDVWARTGRQPHTESPDHAGERASELRNRGE